MSLPAKVKTWQYAVGTLCPATWDLTLDHQQVLLAIKDAMIGFALVPWTVRGSSDASTAGMDTTDRWTSEAKIVWNAAGVAHSWMVLRQTGILTNYEICIDCSGLSGGVQGPALTVVVSPGAGFTGGSTTNRPTATDEIVKLNSAQWVGTNAFTPTFQARVQAMGSTDGKATRIVVHREGIPVAFWLFDLPSNGATGWTNPNAAIVLGATSLASVITAANLNAAANASCYHANVFSCYLTGLGYRGGLAAQRQAGANSWTGEHPADPIGLACETHPNYGFCGTLYDLFWGPGYGDEGGSFPDTVSRTWVQFGALIHPWDGSVPLIS